MGIKPAQAQADPGGENYDVTERISVLKEDLTAEYNTSAGPCQDLAEHLRVRSCGPWVHFSATKTLVVPLRTPRRLRRTLILTGQHKTHAHFWPTTVRKRCHFVLAAEYDRQPVQFI